MARKREKILDMGKYLDSVEPAGYDLECHNCGECEDWAIYVKEIDGKLYVNGMACTSGQCQGKTYLHVGSGAIR